MSNNDDDESTETYNCDICGKKIPDEFHGLECPNCGRIICSDCILDCPITTVEVKPNGYNYERYQDMCKICLDAWKRRHNIVKQTKQVSLDGTL